MALSKAEAELRKKRHFFIEGEVAEQILAGIPDDYNVIGPIREKLAVKYGPIESAADLAYGVTSKEDRGSYKLEDTGNHRLGNARPINSPKRFTHKPEEVLYETSRTQQGNIKYTNQPTRIEKQAFFGLKPCDVNAMNVMDLTFNKNFHDPAYDRNRRKNIIIALNCLEPGENCFCATFDTGPTLKSGFDLCLTELDSGYLVEVGSKVGAQIIDDAYLKPASQDMVEVKEERAHKARHDMSKAFDLSKAVQALNENYDHPYWEQPSERCLSCANCINVCPTCYCYQIRDKSTVSGSKSVRTRTWDACQNLAFAAVHGGNFRPNRADRLRQWVNHKLNWTIEQYGRAGCVGCGRCITWCPTRIDITEPVWRLGGEGVKLDS